MHRFKAALFTLVLILLLLGYFVTAERNCQQASFTYQQSVNINGFLDGVWPEPNSKISAYCYLTKIQGQKATGRGIGAGLQSEKIDLLIWEKPADMVDPLYKRVSLTVDGEKVSSVSFAVLSDGLELVVVEPNGSVKRSGRSTGYDVSWAPLLFPGKHTAQIQVIRDTGEILTYTWIFTITLF